jgi:hypothetical protein
MDFLWRYDRMAGSGGIGAWTEKPLRSVNAPPAEHVGSSMLMTPWRILALGGFEDRSFTQDGAWHGHGYWFGRGLGHGSTQGDGSGHKHQQSDGDR